MTASTTPIDRRAPAERPALQLRPARIEIRNLHLRTFIGFKDEEQEKRQDVLINAAIEYDAAAAAADDAVGRALDYKAITKAIIGHVEGSRFLLLEKLVRDVLEIIHQHPEVRCARVTADKPGALRFAESVALTLETRPEGDAR